MLSLSNFLQFYLCVMVIYSHLYTSDTNIFVRLSHHFRTLGCRVILSSVWVVDRLQWCLCLSLSLSLPSVFAMLGGDDQRTGEDLVARRGGSADAKILYVLFCLTAFSCISHLPSKEPGKGKRNPVFVLHSPTQREIFIRSFSEMERLRGTRRGEERDG